MIHKISGYIFPNPTADFVLDCLDFYYILATEYMINSKLQPLASYYSERELSISPSSLLYFPVGA